MNFSIIYFHLITLNIMKEIKKLKLVNLSSSELAKKELNKLRGGGCCICGCPYPDISGTMTNAGANNAGDKYYAGGGYGNGDFA